MWSAHLLAFRECILTLLKTTTITTSMIDQKLREEYRAFQNQTEGQSSYSIGLTREASALFWLRKRFQNNFLNMQYVEEGLDKIFTKAEQCERIQMVLHDILKK